MEFVIMDEFDQHVGPLWIKLTPKWMKNESSMWIK
jgi:hypothetical protein